jgi:hypothetical protein
MRPRALALAMALLGIGMVCAAPAQAAFPGANGKIKEGLRAIWQIGRVRVDDAGPDGNPDTAADNTVVATQGVFVP